MTLKHAEIVYKLQATRESLFAITTSEEEARSFKTRMNRLLIRLERIKRTRKSILKLVIRKSMPFWDIDLTKKVFDATETVKYE